MKIGLQMYTVRDAYENEEEFKVVLKKIKELGYEGVEFAGYAGMRAEELKDFLDDIGLTAISSHQSLEDLEHNLEAVISYNKTLGCKFVACAFAPTDTMQEVEHIVKVMSNAKEVLEEKGLTLLYHNHSHEFKKVEPDHIPLERIKEYSNLELDSYWAFHAEIEPCSYIRKNAEKICLLHLKDGDFNGNPLALGEGYNNIKGIVETAKIVGLDWIIVENDNPLPDGLSDVARSITYLKSNVL